jgi:hypothetical protein
MRDAPMPWFRKHHTCHCGTDWWDEWDCLCNDRCPKCNAEIAPDTYQAIEGDKSAKIRALNDRLRKSLTGGRIVMTAGVSALPDDVRAQVIQLTRTFKEFTPDNDPHNEHDFGSFEIDGQKFFFKHDYYDESMQYGSEDPSDLEKAKRVPTIMRAEEY